MDEEVRQKTKSIIAGVLRIPAEDVTDTTDLVGELGADSMDFIDILFSLGREFGVEFVQEGMVAKLEQLFGPGVLSERGRLTELGARVMQERRPEIDPARITPGMPTDQLNKLFSTETWVRAVLEILAARPESCPECGAGSLTTKNAGLACGDCGAEVPCPTQAELLEAWVAAFKASNASSSS